MHEHVCAGAALAGDTLSGTALLLLEADGALVCLRPQRRSRQHAEEPSGDGRESNQSSRQPSSIPDEYQVCRKSLQLLVAGTTWMRL